MRRLSLSLAAVLALALLGQARMAYAQPAATPAPPQPAADEAANEAAAEPAPEPGAAEKATAPAPPRGPQPETPPRPPPLPPQPDRPQVPWGRNIEIGGDVAFVARTADQAPGSANAISYEPTVGFGIHARWDVYRYLRFTAYFVDARHDVVLPPGALGLENAELDLPPVYTFVFGAKLGPMLRLSERARIWLSVGIGYGRLEFDKMTVTDASGTFEVRDRDDPFLEVPFSGGVSLDVIRNWLTVELEISGSWVGNEEGDALRTVSAQDPGGRQRTVGGFPGLSNSFVQTLGLSLVL